MAEAKSVGVGPHNPLGAVLTAACGQLDAATHNIPVQEYPPDDDSGVKADLVQEPLKREGGYLIVPDKPGIGVELNEEAFKHYPPVSYDRPPLVNPDGYERRKRRNANNVDINRNFPTSNWKRTTPRSRMFGGETPGSEPETLAVIEAVKHFRPACIVTVHPIGGARYCNNYDGPGSAMAKKMKKSNGYPVRASIGYPTPGSFGAWAGRERHIPIITLELPSRDSLNRCWEDNRDAFLNLP